MMMEKRVVSARNGEERIASTKSASIANRAHLYSMMATARLLPARRILTISELDQDSSSHLLNAKQAAKDDRLEVRR